MKIDEKEIFVDEFNKTVEEFIKRFPHKDGQEKQIVGHMINNSIRNIRKDILEIPSFKDLYQKRLKGTLYIEREDLTKSETVEVINESYLTERDKQLATMYFVEYRSEQEIADKLGFDIRTIRNNIPKISLILKKTYAKLK